MISVTRMCDKIRAQLQKRNARIARMKLEANRLEKKNRELRKQLRLARGVEEVNRRELVRQASELKKRQMKLPLPPPSLAYREPEK